MMLMLMLPTMLIADYGSDADADSEVDADWKKKVLKGEKVDGAFGTGKTLNSGLIIFDILMNCHCIK